MTEHNEHNLRERVAPSGGGVAGERISLRDLVYMRAHGGQAPPQVQSVPTVSPGSLPTSPAVVKPPAAPRGNPQWARMLYALGAILSVIAALAALAPRDQWTPVDPHSVPALSGDPISGTTCGLTAYPVTATLISTAGPFNLYSIGCSNGVTTTISR